MSQGLASSLVVLGLVGAWVFLRGVGSALASVVRRQNGRRI